MGKIKTLAPHVADLIAAGEVVERPGSAVKELLENAIDAGAAAVTVEIESGGMRYIRVTDDGSGIPAEDAATAFLRHATSKISTEYDLEGIGTLGFRGEALAAIAAVSRVDLLTRTEEDGAGTAISLEAGVPGETLPAGCPKGTTIIIRDLFFNTPARMKFMKKDAAEGIHAFGMVQKIALSHPEVSVKFIRDGREELHTPGDGKLSSAVYSVFGRDFAKSLTEARGSGEDIAVYGFVSRPECCRGTRSQQHFFVNGRFVKSRTMAAALEEAYKNQKMTGKFPACVLHVTVKPSAVDVNVHPTKTEVKFVSEKRLFDAVYHTVLAALEGDTVRPRLETLQNAAPRAVDPAAAPGESGFSGGRTPGGQASRTAIPGQGRAEKPELPPIFAAFAESKEDWGMVADETRVLYGAGKTVILPAALSEHKAAPPKSMPAGAGFITPAFAEESPSPAEKPASEPAMPFRMAGELFDTYILVEAGERFLVIDKHAAHERMQFDRLKAEGYVPMSQQLLTPVVFTPSGEEGAALLQNASLLSEFGFEAEEFGGGSLVVRRVPFDIEPGEAEAVLSEIADTLLTGGRADPQGARDRLLSTLACKSAVKGGQKNDPEELKEIAAAVVSGKIRSCPHGRPVALELTRRELEKQIKRG